MAVRPRLVGRRATLLAIMVLAIPVVVFTTLSMRGTTAWMDYGIEPISPSFSDMRAVTTAADCAREGIDTLARNPCHPYDLPAPYPRVWVTLTTVLGVSERHTVWMAGLAAAAFVAGVWPLLRLKAVVEAIVWTVVLCSPPILLAVERGSLDLAVFGLLAVAVLAARHGRRPTLAWAAWMAAVLAKLFPLLSGAALLVSGGRRMRRMGIGVIAILCAWLVLTLNDLRTINRVVPQGVRVSYGARVIFAHLAGDVVTPEQRTWGFLLAGAAILVVVLFVTPKGPVPATHVHAFHVGVLTYASTFVLGSNWEYRLMFLLFALPQLLEWVRNEDSRLRVQAVATLALIVAVLWLGHGGRTEELVDDVASWALLLCLTGLVRATMPEFPMDWWRRRRLRSGLAFSEPGERSPVPARGANWSRCPSITPRMAAPTVGRLVRLVQVRNSSPRRRLWPES